jgi:Flp pilus assembly protein TadG
MLGWLSKPGRLGGGESGQALLLIAFLTLLAAMMAALAVDLGFYLTNRRDLQNDVDAAALASAPYLPGDRDKAEEAALDWAERNGLDGNVSVSFTCTSEYEIACDPANDVWDTVVVTGERNVDLFFGRIVGLDSLKVNATAAGCSPACGVAPQPLDLVMILDRSGSMGDAGGNPPQPMQDAKDAAKLLVDQLNPTIDRVGLVSYADRATLDEGLTDEFDDVKDAIDGMHADGYTNIADGVFDAQRELDTNGRPDAAHIMVVLSDGVANRYRDPPLWCTTWPSSPTRCTDAAISEAATAKGKDTHIFTIGLNLDGIGDIYGSAVEGLARSVLQSMATSPASENYFEAPDSSDLAPIFQEIGWKLIGGIHLVQ